jgi:hypothetical protein
MTATTDVFDPRIRGEAKDSFTRALMLVGGLGERG